MQPFECKSLGLEATIQFVPFGNEAEYLLKDGSGSCVVLTLAELLVLKGFLEKL